MKRSFGTVMQVPRQEPGAVAMCAYCPCSRFVPNRKRKRGNSTSRAKRALWGHVKAAHKDKMPKVWVP
jgi:hypothetical protein